MGSGKQYKEDSNGELKLRLPEEVETNSLQSPHDREATCRTKDGESYPGDHVVNVSATATPESPVQLITNIQVEPNQADDTTLMEQSLDN